MSANSNVQWQNIQDILKAKRLKDEFQDTPATITLPPTCLWEETGAQEHDG